MPAENPTTSIVRREIPECPGYEFGSDGSAWTRWGRGRSTPTGPLERIHPHRRPTGFREFRVRIDGERTVVTLHEMICWAFHGPRPEGHECLFRDGDRDNLAQSNLEWRCLIAEAIASGAEFREIAEAPGYRFGSDGSIWSAWGSGNRSTTDVWRRLELTPSPSGHLGVQVKWDGKKRGIGAHHLTCWAFHGPCPPGLECCHKDGIPDHNEPGNLYWGTPKQNTADQFAHGVFAHGERSPRATFTEDEVREIRRLYAAGMTCGQIAKAKGRSRATIKSIVGRFCWRHVS